MSLESNVTHVIFDLDGLLVDTETLYTAATQKILDRYGKSFDWSIKSKIMGCKPLDAARCVVEILNLPLTAKKFNEELMTSLELAFPGAQLMPGAALLVKHLNRCGIPLAVATGSTIHTYQLKISMHSDVFSCFHHVVCSDDNEVVKGKPSPHIYLTAAKRFNTPPSSNKHVLVFEDALNGVAAAKAAEMKCVMVPDPRSDRDSCQEADRVINSLEEVDLEEWGIPPLPVH